MEFLKNIHRISDAEFQEISADTMNFMNWTFADAFPVITFTIATIIFIWAGFGFVGWL